MSAAEESSLVELFKARVKFDYNAEDDTEVTITGGEVISIFKTSENGWWFAETMDGASGWVPSNFLEKLDGTTPQPVAMDIESTPLVESLKMAPPAEKVARTQHDPLPHLPLASNPEEGCSGCKREFESGYVVAGSRKLHEECFVCAGCSRSLIELGFVERDEKMWCEEDYHKEYAPKCAGCSNPLKGAFLNAMDKGWHKECFVCAACKNPFPDGLYRKHEEQPFCERDFNELFAIRCSNCNKPIGLNFIEAFDKPFHPECFTCTEGHTIGEGEDFYEKNGRAICAHHYKTIVLEKCGKCSQVLEGEYVSVAGKGFHSHCFTCTECNRSVIDGKFDFVKDKVYCHTHAKVLKAGETAVNASKSLPSTTGKVASIAVPVEETESKSTAPETVPVPVAAPAQSLSAAEAPTCPPAKKWTPPTKAGGSKPATSTSKAAASKGADTGADIAAQVAALAKKRRSVNAQIVTRPAASKSVIQRAPPEGEMKESSSKPADALKTSATQTSALDYQGPFYPYEALKNKKFDELPAGVDPSKKEMYLSDEEFRKVLGMGKADFFAHKDWKKKKLKSEAGIW